MSQVIPFPASTRAEKRIHTPARPTIRLPRLSRVPFWVWSAIYAVTGSVVVVTVSR